MHFPDVDAAERTAAAADGWYTAELHKVAQELEVRAPPPPSLQQHAGRPFSPSQVAACRLPLAVVGPVQCSLCSQPSLTAADLHRMTRRHRMQAEALPTDLQLFAPPLGESTAGPALLRPSTAHESESALYLCCSEVALLL